MGKILNVVCTYESWGRMLDQIGEKDRFSAFSEYDAVLLAEHGRPMLVDAAGVRFHVYPPGKWAAPGVRAEGKRSSAGSTTVELTVEQFDHLKKTVRAEAIQAGPGLAFETHARIMGDILAVMNRDGNIGRMRPMEDPPRTESQADPNTPLRMFIALKLLRAWGGQGLVGGAVVSVVNEWIDGGMNGPIPWPGGLFFETWAADNGYSRVGDSIGFHLEMSLLSGVGGEEWKCQIG